MSHCDDFEEDEVESTWDRVETFIRGYVMAMLQEKDGLELEFEEKSLTRSFLHRHLQEHEPRSLTLSFWVKIHLKLYICKYNS
jgi:hypothetical protein